MADRFGMERPTYFPSLFVLLPPLRKTPCASGEPRRRRTTLLNLRHAGSMALFAAGSRKKEKKERARRMETRRAALLERLGNESFVDGRVRVDHKKRITGTMSGYG